MDRDWVNTIFRFADLVEGKDYYAKYISLYEDDDGVLWCENSFTEYKESRHMCYDHTIKVVKKDDALFHYIQPWDDIDIKKGKLPKWGIKVHGPGSIEKYFDTRVRIHNPLPEVNHTYTVTTAAENRTGWILPWALIRVADDKWLVHASYDLGGKRGDKLFVKKSNGKLLVDEDCVRKQKDYEIVDTSAFIGTVYMGKRDPELARALGQRAVTENISIGKQPGKFIEAIIVKDLCKDNHDDTTIKIFR